MKRWIIAVGAVVTSIPAVLHADTRDDVLMSLSNCADIPDDNNRHLCFDRFVPQLKSLASSRPPGGIDQPASSREAARDDTWFDFGNMFGSNPAGQKTVAQFGSDKLPAVSTPETRATQQSVGPSEVENISATVVRYWVDAHGYFIVLLDNGQMWGQLLGDDTFAQFRATGKNTIVISRGFFHSYNLQLNGLGENYKVRRLQ